MLPQGLPCSALCQRPVCLLNRARGSPRAAVLTDSHHALLRPPLHPLHRARSPRAGTPVPVGGAACGLRPPMRPGVRLAHRVFQGPGPAINLPAWEIELFIPRRRFMSSECSPGRPVFVIPPETSTAPWCAALRGSRSRAIFELRIPHERGQAASRLLPASLSADTWTRARSLSFSHHHADGHAVEKTSISPEAD